jgi:hypothetical protein
LLAAMQRVWEGVSDTIITDLHARIVQTVESVEYGERGAAGIRQIVSLSNSFG